MLRAPAATLAARLRAFPVPPKFRMAIRFALPARQILRQLRVRLPKKFAAWNAVIAISCDSALLEHRCDRARFSVSFRGGIRVCRERPSGKLPGCSRLRQQNPRACRKGG